MPGEAADPSRYNVQGTHTSHVAPGNDAGRAHTRQYVRGQFQRHSSVDFSGEYTIRRAVAQHPHSRTSIAVENARSSRREPSELLPREKVGPSAKPTLRPKHFNPGKAILFHSLATNLTTQLL